MKTFLDGDRERFGKCDEYDILEGEADDYMEEVEKAVNNAGAKA